MFTSQSSEHCQSKFFKEWHPDYIASYNSLGDPHLRHFFNHPARKSHLTKNHQVSTNTNCESAMNQIGILLQLSLLTK